MSEHAELRSLGFQHLDLEVTVPRVGIFREAIVELFEMAARPKDLESGLGGESKARWADIRRVLVRGIGCPLLNEGETWAPGRLL